MHSPSKYALILSAHFPPMSLLRSTRSALPMKQMQMETASHVSGAPCEDPSIKACVACGFLSFLEAKITMYSKGELRWFLR